MYVNVYLYDRMRGVKGMKGAVEEMISNPSLLELYVIMTLP